MARCINFTFITLLISLSLSASVSAAQHSITAKVARLNTLHNDITTNPYGGSKVYLDTTESVGSCPKEANDRVIFWIRQPDGLGVNERMFNMLMTAYITGTEVTVRADDTKRDAVGVCFLQFVQFGS